MLYRCLSAGCCSQTEQLEHKVQFSCCRIRFLFISGDLDMNKNHSRTFQSLHSAAFKTHTSNKALEWGQIAISRGCFQTTLSKCQWLNCHVPNIASEFWFDHTGFRRRRETCSSMIQTGVRSHEYWCPTWCPGVVLGLQNHLVAVVHELFTVD